MLTGGKAGTNRGIPAGGAARSGRLEAAGALQRVCAAARRCSAAQVAALIRVFLAAGWTTGDLVYALDHGPDGVQLAARKTRIRAATCAAEHRRAAGQTRCSAPAASCRCDRTVPGRTGRRDVPVGAGSAPGERSELISAPARAHRG